MTTTRSKVTAFRPPQRRRIHQDVAEQLRDAILDGRLRTGQKLPPERELAEEFRVNRTSVREAIKVLEGLGLVSVRQGDGATVQPLIEGSLDLLAPMIFHGGRVNPDVVTEMAEVLMPLLFEMARLAIERRRAAQLDDLRRLRDLIADEARRREDRFASARDVIVLVSDMTRNRVWQMLGRRLRALLASEPMREARQRLRRDPGRIVPIIDACLAAIDAGRPREAIAALRRMISFVNDTELRSNGRLRIAARV
ncbi:MAG: FadR family transcriptional regulator [Deltaproteobacteria bacterium]|nr:FadR family transcriptional regulator [Deltaproteobacteria bacterium]MBI3387531.1 FadR family transcriptional regulator [Deltaproteobacteria bacterium]